MNQLLLLNPENVNEAEVATYPLREAARAIVIDEEGKVALLHVTTGNYYKLPGGGVDEGEDLATALKRECMEELGCNIEVIAELGFITEYRKIFTLKQVGYGYVAKVVGPKGTPSFTDDELANGFEVVWLPYEEAKQMIAASKANNVEGNAYIVPRELTFLTEAQKYLK